MHARSPIRLNLDCIIGAHLYRPASVVHRRPVRAWKSRRGYSAVRIFLAGPQQDQRQSHEWTRSRNSATCHIGWRGWMVLMCNRTSCCADSHWLGSRLESSFFSMFAIANEFKRIAILGPAAVAICNQCRLSPSTAPSSGAGAEKRIQHWPTLAEEGQAR